MDLNLKKQSGRRDLTDIERRTYCVSVRLNSAELAKLDDARGGYQRGESLRMATIGNLPRPRIVPAINEQLVFELSRSLGNLATLASFLRKHEPERAADKQLTEDCIHQVRQIVKQLKGVAR